MEKSYSCPDCEKRRVLKQIDVINDNMRFCYKLKAHIRMKKKKCIDKELLLKMEEQGKSYDDELNNLRSEKKEVEDYYKTIN
jgi:hypothetical protein